jgi:hypothetical protein
LSGGHSSRYWCQQDSVFAPDRNYGGSWGSASKSGAIANSARPGTSIAKPPPRVGVADLRMPVYPKLTVREAFEDEHCPAFLRNARQRNVDLHHSFQGRRSLGRPLAAKPGRPTVSQWPAPVGGGASLSVEPSAYWPGSSCWTWRFSSLSGSNSGCGISRFLAGLGIDGPPPTAVEGARRGATDPLLTGRAVRSTRLGTTGPGQAERGAASR